MSTINIVQSCDTIILVLSLQIFRRSIMSPKTTNVVKEQKHLEDLHAGEPDGQLGSQNVGAKLLGSTVGIRVDQWFCRWGRWLVILVIVCEAPLSFFAAEMKEGLRDGLRVAAAFVYLLLAVSVLLCLRVHIVKRLCGQPGVWYA